MRILLVEDEEGLAATIRGGLTEAGHVVDLVHTGTDGLWSATENRYDVVVLDILLPELSGYRVLQSLRERQVWTPVLMLTAKDGEHDEADAFDLGADDYLTKPFSFLVLLARLRALQRRHPRARPVVLTVGPVTLDPAVHRVMCAGRPVAMTGREYGVLEYLMRNAGSAVRKVDILEAVWDPHYEGDMNIVEVYAGYVRRKTAVPRGRAGSIETVRGVGYRMLAADEVVS